LIAGFVN